jgi:hypothetical protein
MVPVARRLAPLAILALLAPLAPLRPTAAAAAATAAAAPSLHWAAALCGAAATFSPAPALDARPPPLVAACLASGGEALAHRARAARAPPPRLSVLVSVGGHGAEGFLPGFVADARAQTLLPAAELLLGASREVFCGLAPASLRLLEALLADAAGGAALALHPADPGLYAVWNGLIADLARAPLLTTANLDDRRRPDAWALRVARLDEDAAVDVVASAVVPVAEALPWGEAVARGALNFSAPWYAHLADAALLQLGDLFFPGTRLSQNFPHNAPVWRAALHARVGAFDAARDPYADWALWVAARRAGAVFHLLPEPTELYLVAAASYQRRGGEADDPRTGLPDARAHAWSAAVWAEAGAGRPEARCVPRRLLVLAGALGAPLRAGDAAAAALAAELGGLACARPVVAARAAAGGAGEAAARAAFDRAGCDFAAVGAGLEGLPALLAARGPFDTTFALLDLGAGAPAPAGPEALRALPRAAAAALGAVVALAPRVEWLARAQATAVAAEAAETAPPSGYRLEAGGAVFFFGSAADAVAVAALRAREVAAVAGAAALLVGTRWEGALAAPAGPRVCKVPPAVRAAPEEGSDEVVAAAARPAPRGALCFLFAGAPALDAPGAEWLLGEVWPHFDERDAAALSLRFPGPAWPAARAACAAAGARCAFGAGTAPAGCWAAVAPARVRVAGLQAAAVAALAAGAPVVATRAGAASAELECGVEAVGSAGAFAAALAALLRDADAHAAAARRGRACAAPTNLPGCLAKLIEGTAF